MHNHFDKYLNLKKWILERFPKHIVECGVGNGELSRKIDSLRHDYDFDFTIISDNVPKGLMGRNFRPGLSYEVLSKMDDSSIDLCIIDTDHNFWTLMKELSAVFSKIRDGGLIALHDVETFYHDTGMACSYWNDLPYPKKEILEHAPYGGLGDALMEFLCTQKMTYKLLAYTHESHGAALIEKRPQSQYAVIIPGSNPIFAKQIKEEILCNASN